MLPVVHRFLDHVTRHAPEYRDALNPPAADLDLQELAAKGEHLRAWVDLHRMADGTDKWVSLVQGLELLSLESSARIKTIMDSLEADGTFDKWAPHQWWNPAWIPILDNHSYDTYVIDLEGYKGSKPGQILRWSKDSSTRTVVAPSFDDWLAALSDLIESGDLLWQPDEGGFHSPTGALLDELISAHFPGYPKHFEVSTRLELGMARVPKPVTYVKQALGFAAHVESLFWAPGQEGVAALAWVDELQLLAVGQLNYGGAPCPTLSLVDPLTGNVKVLIEEEEGGILGMVWLADRSELVYLLNASGRSIRVWNAKTQQKRSLLENSWDTRMNDAFDAAGDLVLHAGKAVALYDLNGGAVRQAPFVPHDEVSAAFVRGGQTMGVHLPGGPLRILDTRTFEVVRELQVPMEKLGTLVFNSRGDSIMLDWYNRQMARLDASGQALSIPDDRSASTAVWMDDLRWAVGHGGTLRIYDQDSKELYSDLAHANARNIALAYDPQFGRLFSGGSDGSIAVRKFG